jgi:negative regulator of genetic competence, sporulation and motility
VEPFRPKVVPEQELEVGIYELKKERTCVEESLNYRHIILFSTISELVHLIMSIFLRETNSKVFHFQLLLYMYGTIISFNNLN